VFSVYCVQTYTYIQTSQWPSKYRAVGTAKLRIRLSHYRPNIGSSIHCLTKLFQLELLYSVEWNGQGYERGWSWLIRRYCPSIRPQSPKKEFEKHKVRTKTESSCDAELIERELLFLRIILRFPAGQDFFFAAASRLDFGPTQYADQQVPGFFSRG
jgi:hypothetical protein